MFTINYYIGFYTTIKLNNKYYVCLTKLNVHTIIILILKNIYQHSAIGR